MGKNVQEWTAPYDQERNLKEVQKCFKKGYVANLEIDYEGATGEITPVEINAKLVEQEGEKIILAIIVAIFRSKGTINADEMNLMKW